MKTIAHIYWAVLVHSMTGLDLGHIQDTQYAVLPFKKIIPDPWLGLKTLPYIKNGADCDDRSKIGYGEIHKGLRRHIRKTGLFVPLCIAVGHVKGFGNHEFLLIGGEGVSGKLEGRYYHRLEDRFEEIEASQVTDVRVIL